jgi:hypothetical protein
MFLSTVLFLLQKSLESGTEHQERTGIKSYNNTNLQNHLKNKHQLLEFYDDDCWPITYTSFCYKKDFFLPNTSGKK